MKNQLSEVTSFRDAMADALLLEMDKNELIVIVCPDLVRAVRIDKIADKYPQRLVNVGICEDNMVGIAAGIATLGFTPILVGFAMFVAEKPFELLRNIVAYPNFNIKIIATHSGIGVGQDGATHQATEDIAILRTLPNFKVLAACDAEQTKHAISAMIRDTGPAYLRLGRDKAITIYKKNEPFVLGKSDIIFDGKDITIISMGTMITNSYNAALELRYEDIDVALINMYSIKPLDKERILEYAKKTKAIVTVEDHMIAGGLGSSIAEYLSQEYPTKMKFIGVKDIFGESGTEDKLYKKHGMDVFSIKSAVIKLLQKE